MATIANLYEHYTSNGLQNGLSADGDDFKLNNKSITIFSGALHYFRIHPEYWTDRLRKLKFCGLNTVETYIPWNLHEPQMDFYDFGDGEHDMSIFCQVEKFIKLAQREDLFVIIRPGPYICAEWEFGGMPSYLLRDEDIGIRTSNPKFIDRVEKYFKELFKILAPLQFTKHGPIIAFQIENEYGSVKEEGKVIDKNYLLMLKQIMEQNGVVELLFTSDTPSLGFSGTIPGVLATANFQTDPEKELKLLKTFQPDRPLMVMEFWTGWFDHWTEQHETRSLESFSSVLEILLKEGASVNFYMFHGGTNWGFLNGANNASTNYQADTTSYDYDSLLSEAGDYTEKYYKAKELITKYNKIYTRPTSEPPPSQNKVVYPTLFISKMIEFEEIFNQITDKIISEKPIPMELLRINNKSGQSYGYIIYRKTGLDIPKNSQLKITGKIRDQAIVLINGVLKSKPLNSVHHLNHFGYWKSEDSTLCLNNEDLKNATLDIMVNNWGRVNFGKLDDFEQHKGLYRCVVSLNGQVISNWTIAPLEFKKAWNQNLSNWKNIEPMKGPALYKVEFCSRITEDTFLDMSEWCQGIVVVNGFVLGRYCSLGPQRTLYLPGPLLRNGSNTILVFEQFERARYVKFSRYPILDSNLISNETEET